MLPWSVKQMVTCYLQIWVRYEEHYSCVFLCQNLQGNA